MLKPKQIKMYRPEWAKASKRLKAAGRDGSDAARMKIHALVTGFECSSKDLTNRELDAVLLHFRTIINHVGEFPAILAFEQSALVCCRFASRRLAREAVETVKDDDHADRYIEGISRQMFKNNTKMLDLTQWQAICAALKIQAGRKSWSKKDKAGEDQADPPYVAPVDESQPF